MIWVDLGVGDLGATLVQGVKDWRRKWKNKEPYGAYDALPPMTAEQVADALDAEFVVDVDELIAFVRARAKTVFADPKAKAYMLQRWPEGVPTPKQGLSDPDQIEQVLTLLDKVEAEFSIPFPEADPRVQPGVHQGDLFNSKQGEGK